MKPVLSSAAVLFGLALAPAVADAQSETASTASAKNGAVTDGIPVELQQFSGMLIGKMISRDVERGEFTAKVDHVSRVWENNKATQPRVAVGKTFTVEGVTGKWLDSLLLIRPGDTLEFEAQHRSGDRLSFLGEGLRKVAAFDPADHPAPPESFRGFAGIVVGQIESKQDESGELVIRINRIEKTFDKNEAKDAESAVGKSIVLAGFWGKMRKPFDELKTGDRVRAGILHRVRQSDHFTVAEFIEQTSTRDGETTADQ